MADNKKPVEVMHRASNILPVFTPKEILTGVTTLEAEQAVAFVVHTDCTYQINGTGPAAPLITGDVRGFPIGVATLVFSVPVVLEIM